MTLYDLWAWMKCNDLQTWATVVQALAAVILISQLLLVRLNIRGTTQDSLYAHYTEVCKLFVDKPYLRPYFYDERPKPISCPADRPLLNNEIDAASEMILGLIEHAIMQRRNLPGDSWWACWEPYAKERVQTSPTIREFYEKNKGWYALALRDQIDLILGRKETRWARAMRLLARKAA